jgi:hypothetical protein
VTAVEQRIYRLLFELIEARIPLEAVCSPTRCERPGRRCYPAAAELRPIHA